MWPHGRQDEFTTGHFPRGRPRGARPLHPRTALSPAQRAAASKTLGDFARHGVSGYAPNSLRSLRVDWSNWLTFCLVVDRVAMPIAFDDLHAFIDDLIGRGPARATISHHLATLRMMSRMYACPDPMDSPVAKAYWRDVCRARLIATQKQARGLTLADVDRMTAGLDLSDARAARDAAMVRMAYDLLARASEMVAVTWEAIEFNDEGDGTYLFGRTKTDPGGTGVQVLPFARDLCGAQALALPVPGCPALRFPRRASAALWARADDRPAAPAGRSSRGADLRAPVGARRA